MGKGGDFMNYENVVLTLPEKIVLLRIHRLGFRTNYDEAIPGFNRLVSYNFISPCIEWVAGRSHVKWFQTTDEYKHFLVWKREQRIHRYFTPVMVSIVTTIATLVLKELLAPMLPSVLADILRGLV